MLVKPIQCHCNETQSAHSRNHATRYQCFQVPMSTNVNVFHFQLSFQVVREVMTLQGKVVKFYNRLVVLRWNFRRIKRMTMKTRSIVGV